MRTLQIEIDELIKLKQNRFCFKVFIYSIVERSYIFQELSYTIYSKVVRGFFRQSFSKLDVCGRLQNAKNHSSLWILKAVIKYFEIAKKPLNVLTLLATIIVIGFHRSHLLKIVKVIRFCYQLVNTGSATV